MKAVKRVFQNRDINNLTVAFIIATSTVNFVFFIGQQLFIPIIQSEGPKWSWDQFWPQFVIWVVLLIVAIGLSTLAKDKK